MEIKSYDVRQSVFVTFFMKPEHKWSILVQNMQFINL